jgi:hypothetical protein
MFLFFYFSFLYSLLRRNKVLIMIQISDSRTISHWLSFEQSAVDSANSSVRQFRMFGYFLLFNLRHTVRFVSDIIPVHVIFVARM